MWRLRLLEGEERRSQKSGKSNTKLAVQLDVQKGTFKRRIQSISEKIWFLTCMLLTILTIIISFIEVRPC
jgi:hypothetical protein